MSQCLTGRLLQTFIEHTLKTIGRHLVKPRAITFRQIITNIRGTEGGGELGFDKRYRASYMKKLIKSNTKD